MLYNSLGSRLQRGLGLLIGTEYYIVSPQVSSPVARANANHKHPGGLECSTNLSQDGYGV